MTVINLCECFIMFIEMWWSQETGGLMSLLTSCWMSPIWFLSFKSICFDFFLVDANTLTAMKCFYFTGLEQEKFGKRRKKSSSSRSRHSSRNSNLGEDCDRITGDIIDIHQLENEAFLDGHEISDSFSIEFASSGNKGLALPKNGFYIINVEDSASNSVIFRHSDSSESKVGVRFLCNDI